MISACGSRITEASMKKCYNCETHNSMDNLEGHEMEYVYI